MRQFYATLKTRWDPELVPKLRGRLRQGWGNQRELMEGHLAEPMLTGLSGDTASGLRLRQDARDMPEERMALP